MRAVCTLVVCSTLALATPGLGAEGRGSEADPEPLLADGRFGRAVSPQAPGFAWAEAEPLAAYHQFPITVECWAKLRSRDAFNVIVANSHKHGGNHWEIYSFAGTGCLSAFLPGFTPNENQSAKDITDGQWHYLAMVLEEARVRLYADGEEVLNNALTRNPEPPEVAGPLSVGALPHFGAPGAFPVDGAVDEVRISRGVRGITGVPGAPFEADAQTVALWSFDAVGPDGRSADASASHNDMFVPDLTGKSLDDLDREAFRPGPSPLDSEATPVALLPGKASHPEGPSVLSLNGAWEMAEDSPAFDADRRLRDPWPDAMPAVTPGSVHSALVANGRIPDPTIGQNQRIAEQASYKAWWFKRTFARPRGTARERLVFEGVCSSCSVWLNGRLLGTHKGMFGGPEYEIEGLLQDHNTLIVKLDPAEDWKTDVVFNNCYGWHYCKIPARGIWRPVRVEGAPTVRLDHPFAATRNAQEGVVDLVARLEGPETGWAGTLAATVEPDNFEGAPGHFEHRVTSETACRQVHVRFVAPNPRLWWPNGLGEPNLYRVRLSFTPDGGGAPDCREFPLALRTVVMAPLPGGPRAAQYNWTFVVNGQPVFVKGTNWCTLDPLMNFARDRYERFLSLAHDQHIQMFRPWGSGMPETDEFYDLCDRKGIMVLQEWPTAWNSHTTQPYAALEETVRLNTLRLRNHPSLVMYGAGNESSAPFGRAIDMMGRLSHELDGTRAFHRAEPWGGSHHNYDCYWGRKPLDHNVQMTAPFFGEFGLACMPAFESVMRYLPEEEKGLWPAPADGSLAHHTPIFNTAQDMERLAQYSACFARQDSLRSFVLGSQLSQATGVRHTLERARTRWPECTGALYYKMNDNYPAASWSCVDWYGTPKVSHYVFQDSFAPLLACVVFSQLNTEGQTLALPVYLLDDAGALENAAWRVLVRAYGADLGEIKRQSYEGTGSVGPVRNLGAFELTASQNRAAPLLTVAEVFKNGALAQRTFYWTNYEARQGCLFDLPRTALALETVAGGVARVVNTGSVAAAGVLLKCPGAEDRFTASDGFFWLDPGEAREVRVSHMENLTADALNVPGSPLRNSP